MFEWLVGLMTIGAVSFCQSSQVNRMLKRAGLNVLLRRSIRIIDDGVTHVAVIRNDFARLTDVLPVVASEAPL